MISHWHEPDWLSLIGMFPVVACTQQTVGKLLPRCGENLDSDLTQMSRLKLQTRRVYIAVSIRSGLTTLAYKQRAKQKRELHRKPWSRSLSADCFFSNVQMPCHREMHEPLVQLPLQSQLKIV